MDLLNLLFLLACFVPGCRSFTWNDKLVDGQVIRACAGSDVTFGWVYTLGAQETVTSTEWLFQGHSQEIVAMFSHGTFVVLPTFSQRVQQATNGGFTFSHVTKGDAGNFSVEINGHDASGASMTERKTIVLIVEDMMTSDNPLQVTKSPQPVHDDVSDRYTVELSCGNFSFVDQPPFDVQWTLPSGLVVNSRSYHDNQFHLLVPTPFEGGRYICQIPSQATPLLCLPAGHASPHADVTLDGPLTRLMLMEAEQTSLRQHNHQMAHLVQQLDVNNQQLTHHVQQLNVSNQQLQTANQQLQTDVRQITLENQRLKADFDQLNTSCQLRNAEISLLFSDNQQLKSQMQSFTSANQQLKDDFHQLISGQQEDHLALTSLALDLQRLNSTMCGASSLPGLLVHAVATQSRTYTVPYPAYTDLTLDDVITNRNNVFDPTSSVFTAPRDNPYVFIVSGNSSPAKLLLSNGSPASSTSFRDCRVRQPVSICQDVSLVYLYQNETIKVATATGLYDANVTYLLIYSLM